MRVLLLSLLVAACKQDGDQDPTDETDTDTSGGLSETYSLEGTDLYPESIAWHPGQRQFYLSSLGQGGIVRVYVDGTQTAWLPPIAAGASTQGIDLHPDGDSVWVCVGLDDGTYVVNGYTTGTEPTLIVSVPMGAEGACNDVAVAADGSVYITDPDNPWIQRYDPVADELSLFADDPLLDGGLIALNGITLAPDGEGLLATRYSQGVLLHVTLTNPAVVREVPLTGDTPTLSAGQGFDGMTTTPDGAWVATIQGALKLTPADAAWSSAIVEHHPLPGTGWSSVAYAEGEIYATKGDPIAFVIGVGADLPFELRRVP